MASPDRIALAADARSPARAAMRRLGDAATCSMRARDVSDRSASTTTTLSPRITGWLNTAVSTTKAKSGTPNIRTSARRSCSASAIRARRPAGTRALPSASSAHPPIEIGTHAGPQFRHLVDRVGTDREGAQVEIAGRPGRTPACIFALGGDQLDLDGDAAIGERRYTHIEAVTDLQGLDQVLSKIEVNPQV